MSRFCAVLVLAATVVGCAGAQNRPMLCSELPGLDYPADARAAGIEGVVVVQYDVSEQGGISNIRVISAEPPGVFDAAAVAAVGQLKCSPPVRGGERVAAEGITSTVRYTLGTDDEYAEF